MGLISAFVFAATIAVIPAEAQNSLENAVKADQDADSDVLISGVGNAGFASTSQGIAVGQSNFNGDTQTETGDIALPLP